MSHPKQIKVLEELIWPLLRTKIEYLIKSATDEEIIIIELGAYTEKSVHFESLFDSIILIKRDKNEIMESLLKSKRFSTEEIMFFIKLQEKQITNTSYNHVIQNQNLAVAQQKLEKILGLN